MVVDPIRHCKTSGVASLDLCGKPIPIALTKRVQTSPDVMHLEMQVPVRSNAVEIKIRVVETEARADQSHQMFARRCGNELPVPHAFDRHELIGDPLYVSRLAS